MNPGLATKPEPGDLMAAVNWPEATKDSFRGGM